MMKIGIVVAAITLTGCVATSPYQTQGSVIGAISGAAIGNHIGKGRGRDAAVVLGAVIGSNVGASVGFQLERPRQGGQQYSGGYAQQPDYSVCYQFDIYNERMQCQRGVQNAFKREQDKRARSAYDVGARSNQLN